MIQKVKVYTCSELKVVLTQGYYTQKENNIGQKNRSFNNEFYEGCKVQKRKPNQRLIALSVCALVRVSNNKKAIICETPHVGSSFFLEV